MVYDHNHIFNNKGKRIASQGFKRKDVLIGNNCWIGSNVVILAGTTIGDNCVIGAGSVLHGDIPSSHLVVCESRTLDIRKIVYRTSDGAEEDLSEKPLVSI